MIHQITVIIKPAPLFFNGFEPVPRTDINILYNDQWYGSRRVGVTDNTEAVRQFEAEAFLRRQSR